MDGESHQDREKRIQGLWQILDPTGQGHVDIHGLRRGLKKMDHRELVDANYHKMEIDFLQH